MSSSRFAYTVVLVVVLGVASTVLLESQAGPVTSPSAAYMRGTLHASIPYRAPHAGNGQITLEVLDPEDHVVGRVRREVSVADGKGVWQQQVVLEKPLSTDDLVWHRIRYRFNYAGEEAKALEGTESISEILRTPVLHIIGQQALLAGAPAAVRVVVSDSKNEPITGSGTLRIDVAGQNVYSGKLNARGTSGVQFRVPRL